VGSGAVDSALAGGVEVMSRVPIGSSGRKDLGSGIPIPKSYFPQYEMTSQFEAPSASPRSGASPAPTPTAFGFRSQQNAATAWAEDRFGQPDRPGRGPHVDEEGNVTGTQTISRDEGLRETTLEKLATLKPVAREGRRAHGGFVVADLRRRRGRPPDDGRASRAARASDRRPASSTRAWWASTRAHAHGPIDATQRLFERTGPRVGRHRRR
jgi:acetyl-CoA C-acetyltransferase